jgi:hypothetical protein
MLLSIPRQKENNDAMIPAPLVSVKMDVIM